MANLQAALRSQAATAGEQPERFLRSVNQLLYENTAGGDYATLFFAEYDDRTRKLRYSNCGHPPALLLRGDDTVERLGSTCTVVGLFDKWDCAMEERELAPGDAVLLYTDGITEALHAEQEEFGEERLLEATRQHREPAPSELLAAVCRSCAKAFVNTGRSRRSVTQKSRSREPSRGRGRWHARPAIAVATPDSPG
jgi:sigma-B regulation protein RsbU (phosphoserine phosphatase)